MPYFKYFNQHIEVNTDQKALYEELSRRSDNRFRKAYEDDIAAVIAYYASKPELEFKGFLTLLATFKPLKNSGQEAFESPVLVPFCFNKSKEVVPMLSEEDYLIGKCPDWDRPIPGGDDEIKYPITTSDDMALAIIKTAEKVKGYALLSEDKGGDIAD